MKHPRKEWGREELRNWWRMLMRDALHTPDHVLRGIWMGQASIIAYFLDWRKTYDWTINQMLEDAE